MRKLGRGWSKFGPTVFLATAAMAVVGGVCVQLGMFGSAGAQVSEEPPAISLSSQLLDFGLIPINGNARRMLIVRNDGVEPMHARFAVDDASVYSVEPESLILHPGVGARVAVQVRAKRAGRLHDNLRITVEGRPDAPLLVSLDGQAHAAAAGDDAGLAPLSSRDREARTGFKSPWKRGGGSTDHAASDAAALPYSAEGGATAGNPSTAPRSEIARAAVRTDAREVSGSEGELPRGSVFSRVSSKRAVREFDPNDAAPVASFDDRPAAISGSVTAAEADNASRVSSRVPGGNSGNLPETLPDDENTPPGMRDRDRQSPEDPVRSPTFTIDSRSNVRVLGSFNTFYPQQIAVAGSPSGGSLNLTQEIAFPQVTLSFGEFVGFRQTGPAVGLFDAASGTVRIQVPMVAIDFDGDAAPLPLELTTGSVMARDDAGVVLSMTGSPRVPGTGLVHLVGIQKIPSLFNHGAEEQLVFFDILARLDLGTPLTPSSSDFGRRGR